VVKEIMTLEMRVVKDGEVLFAVPLDYPVEEARRPELDLDEDDIERLANIYSIAANERRLRAMVELIQKGEMSFSELLEVALNPKTVRDWMTPMVKEGMVTHEGRRTPYKPSFGGVVMTMTMTAGLSKLLDFLEQEEEGEALE
jgi:DNA-binding transcriptional ArsR family regulator